MHIYLYEYILQARKLVFDDGKYEVFVSGLSIYGSYGCLLDLGTLWKCWKHLFFIQVLMAKSLIFIKVYHGLSRC